MKLPETQSSNTRRFLASSWFTRRSNIHSSAWNQHVNVRL